MKKPKFDVIETTAMEFAIVWYEAALLSGATSKYKSPRLFALKNIHLFIPNAIDKLTEMLGRSDIHENLKEKIYLAIMERANDPHVNRVFGNKQLLPEIDLKKMLENAPNKPVVIKTNIFDKKQRPIRERLKNSIVKEDNKFHG